MSRKSKLVKVNNEEWNREDIKRIYEQLRVIRLVLDEILFKFPGADTELLKKLLNNF